jgi:hypothetical protein
MSIPHHIGIQIAELSVGREVRGVSHKPNIDTISIDPKMRARMMGKRVFISVPCSMIGLRGISNDTSDARE